MTDRNLSIPIVFPNLERHYIMIVVIRLIILSRYALRDITLPHCFDSGVLACQGVGVLIERQF